jgi:hypothetical protein
MITSIRDQAMPSLARLLFSVDLPCLRAALVADPDRFLEELREHWPEKKPLGRPPRTIKKDGPE